MREEIHTAPEIAAARAGRFGVGGWEVPLKAPVDWTMDPFEAKKFRGALHKLNWLDVLFYVYREEGDLGALAQARNLVLDWVQANPPESPTSDKSWVNKVAAYRSLLIAYTALAASCEGMLGEQDATRLIEAVQEHGDFVAGPAYTPTNKGPAMDIALGKLAAQVPFMASAPGWDQAARARHRDTVAGGIVDSEGFWLEHSSSYHVLVRGLVRRLAEFFGDPDGRLGELHALMTETAGWLVMPNDEYVQLGDSHQKPVTQQVRQAAAGDQGLAWFEETGLAIVKESASYLALTSMFHSGTHKQSDDLSFDLFDSGHQIVSDSGLYEKDPSRWFRFAKSARAHSVLTVDGSELPRESADAYGSGLRARGQGDGWYAILAENPLLWRDRVSHRRLLLYEPGEALIVLDLIRSSKRHTYRRYFQIGPKVDVSKRRDGLKLSAPGFRGNLEIKDGGKGRSQLVKGKRKPLLGFTSPQYRVSVPRWTVIRKTRAHNVDMLAGFRLDKPKPLRAAVKSDPRRWHLRLERGSGTRKLEVAQDGNQLDVAESGR